MCTRFSWVLPSFLLGAVSRALGIPEERAGRLRAHLLLNHPAGMAHLANVPGPADTTENKPSPCPRMDNKPNTGENCDGGGGGGC